MSAILRAIRLGAPLDVFGDGTAVRDYLDADDLADAILLVAGGRELHDVWNVGSGVGHGIIEVIEMIASVTGKHPQLQFKPGRSIDVQRSVLNHSRFSQAFGWQPRTTLRDSIEKIWASQP